MRDTVTPPPTRSARVIDALQRLDAGNLDPDSGNPDVNSAVIEHHAGLIHVAMLETAGIGRPWGRTPR